MIKKESGCHSVVFTPNRSFDDFLKSLVPEMLEQWNQRDRYYKTFFNMEYTSIMDQQKPSIGRIVHYQKYGTPGGEHKAEPSPAVITKVKEDGLTCHLFVMNPNGCYFNETPYSGGEPIPGHWNWPPRV